MIYTYLLGLGAVLSYALLPILAKKINLDVPPLTFIAITMALLTGLSAIAAKLFEKEFFITSISTVNWLWLTAFAMINLIAFSLMLSTLTKMPVIEYQIMGVLIPVIGGLFAYFILAETLTARYFIGLIVMSVGLYIALKK